MHYQIGNNKINRNFILLSLFGKESYVRENKSYICVYQLKINAYDYINFSIRAIRSRIKDEELLLDSKNHKLFLNVYRNAVYDNSLSKLIHNQILNYFKIPSMDAIVTISKIECIVNTSLKFLKNKVYI